MIKILIKFIIDSDGESPKQLLERLNHLGGVPLVGEYDAEIPLSETDRLFPKLEAIHMALKGSGVFYTVSTGSSIGEVINTDASSEQKLTDMKRQIYLAKLARWKEMGVDTSALEELLEKDVDKFREVSKNYLKEHLDKAQIVRDVHRSLLINDEAVFAAVDDMGVKLDEICRLTSLNEHESVLSLSRLITSGRVTRVTKGEDELYLRIKRIRTLRGEGELSPAKDAEEARKRVIDAIHAKGSTFRQICKMARLPEGQAMNALSELLKGDAIRSVKRGKNTVYIRGPAKKKT